MLTIIIALVICSLDQWTKLLVRSSFALHQSLEVIPGFFNLTYVRNPGAVWGILKGWSIILILISFIAIFLFVSFYRSIVKLNKYYRIALGLMLGGIIGNLIDRIRLGWVTDFLDFHLAGWHWPAFNIADSAICIGAFLYVILSFFADKKADRLETHN
ncbi:MAG: signal peptidase II [Lentisphaerae bacterium]|jgi:signal peptidase II|nr:signal peptidase II [Lentisphaerota bacterium]